MSETANYSIYNIKNTTANSPLSFLQGDERKGWNAQRNLLKGLNHLNLLKKKELLSDELNLHNLKTPSMIYNNNYKMLEEHQNYQISTDKVINCISQQISLSNAEINTKLSNNVTLGHMEFHPSDICNLKCKGCTYDQDMIENKPKQICFPFDKIDRLTIFKPKSILLSGGGEPTLYNYSTNNGTYSFADLIHRIKTLMPNIRLALVTNGTHRICEDIIQHFDWIRVSIDAASDETYHHFRGNKLFFDRVIENLLYYLEAPINYVGASFLYSQANITEYVEFAKYLFEKVRNRTPDHLHKFNLQYRPLRIDPKDTGKDFPAAITDAQIKETMSDIVKYARSSIEAEKFLRDQTNIEAVLGGNSQSPHDFSRCYYCQIFHIIRANGEIRPCFIRVSEPDFVLGDILTHSASSISLNSLYIAARKKKHCDPEGCRQCHVNNVFEAGLSGRLEPPKSDTVANDPFF